jgi:hypothetical protein
MVIELAIDHHDRLLAPCDPSSRGYNILKNGLVVRRVKNGKYVRVMEIFAEMREAQLLLAHAHKICPAAAPAITKAMSLARDV